MAAQRTLKRWLLGREIRHMLRVQGVSYDDAGKILKITRNRMVELIDGTRTITVGDLERLATRLGYEQYLDRLEELRATSHKRGFWDSGHNRAYSDDFRLMVEMEQTADLLQTAQVEIMPGLLQCEEYIQALHQDEHMPLFLPANRPDVTVDDYVEARKARQQILLADDAPEYRAILSESCLQRQYGNTKVMHAQADHLLRMSTLPRVTIQVLPFGARPSRAEITHTFVKLRVPSPGLAGPLDVVYRDGGGKISYDDSKFSIVWADATWSRLSMAAMDPEDSRRYISYIADRYYRP